MSKLFGKIDINDILIFIGLILVGYGLYLIRLPLIPIGIGLMLWIMGVLGAWRKGSNK